jgi:hypothetical protein
VSQFNGKRESGAASHLYTLSFCSLCLTLIQARNAKRLGEASSPFSEHTPPCAHTTSLEGILRQRRQRHVTTLATTWARLALQRPYLPLWLHKSHTEVVLNRCQPRDPRAPPRIGLPRRERPAPRTELIGLPIILTTHTVGESLITIIITTTITTINPTLTFTTT